MPKPTGRRHGTRVVPTVRSTTGILGVTIDRSKGPPRVVAAWTGADGKVKKVTRSIAKHGYERALAEVSEIRKQKAAEVNQVYAGGKVYIVRVRGKRADGWQVRWPKWLNSTAEEPCSRFFSVGVNGGEGAAKEAAEQYAKRLRELLLRYVVC